ncbi:hypothetical protein KL918_001587 [Ogataea parapolymorpha]|nr:hypothetical protein KL918_001587 [Ogataea parapolymorpha]KAG7874025.1 hypothetical protein KL916_001799 [Ogataea parapolymorpha]
MVVPFRGRGLYGGALAAQAVVAALQTEQCGEWKPLSIHCHFLAAANPDMPLVYKVEDLKVSKNYQVKEVRLFQGEKLAFNAVCTIQKTLLEGTAGKVTGQLHHHRNPPAVDGLVDQNTAFELWAESNGRQSELHSLKHFYNSEPIEWQFPPHMFDLGQVSEPEKKLPVSERTLWYKLRPKFPAANEIQRWGITAYLTDYFYLNTNMRLNMLAATANAS